jgi:hypothetical protein
MNPIILSRARYFCHAYHPTRDSILLLTAYIIILLAPKLTKFLSRILNVNIMPLSAYYSHASQIYFHRRKIVQYFILFDSNIPTVKILP